MLFNSPEFLFIFLPIALTGCYAFNRFGSRFSIAWLVVCSLFFYGWFKPVYILLILGSISTNYVVGENIVKQRIRGSERSGKILLFSGVFFNLGLLSYFKYFNFFVDTANRIPGIGLSIGDILLPIGISFFTFQQIAYLMDCRQGIVHRTSPLKYSLFVAFFPQLIAGPIVHPKDVLPQFDKQSTFHFRTDRFCQGLTIFLLGLAKKVVLADQFGIWASEGFDAAAGGEMVSLLPAWGAALSYTLQIYFDFSGYSDMAIGLGWMIGIRLPINFRAPYQSTSIIDFWRTWHITLSRFLRDYLYIPLGGNRKGPARRWINLMITMLLGGLWHGAGWTFVFWGFLHGCFLVINHAWRNVCVKLGISQNNRDSPAMKGFSWALTMLGVIIAWVFFRADDFGSALRMLKGMAGLNGIILPNYLADILSPLNPWVDFAPRLELLAGGSIVGLMELVALLLLGWGIVLFGKPLEYWSVRWRYVFLIPTFAFTLQKVLVSQDPSEFLYFQF